MSFSFILVTWFSVVFGDEVTKILCNSLFLYHFCLACLALITENIVQKITQLTWGKREKNEVTKMKRNKHWSLIFIFSFNFPLLLVDKDIQHNTYDYSWMDEPKSRIDKQVHFSGIGIFPHANNLESQDFTLVLISFRGIKPNYLK